MKQSTPNLIVNADLGLYVITVSMKLRIKNFWKRLLHWKEGTICIVFYINTLFILILKRKRNINKADIVHEKNSFDLRFMSNNYSTWNAQYAKNGCHKVLNSSKNSKTSSFNKNALFLIQTRLKVEKERRKRYVIVCFLKEFTETIW